jgi:transcriptional regulator with XRE-family HTH domain
MISGSLAERLRVLRAQRGMTLAKAAEQAGVGRDTLSDLERGRRHPVMPTLAKIAQGYGVPVEELLEEPVPLVEAPQETGHLQVRRLRLKETPTAQLRQQLKALAGNQRAKTIEDLRTREGMQEAVAQSLVMHEATEIRAELLERGEEDPKAYLPDLRTYLDALDLD